MPFADQSTAGAEVATVPMLFVHYVELLEWTGRAVREGAGPSGVLKGPAPALMQRLGLEPKAWVHTMTCHGLRSLGVLGCPEDLDALAERHGKRWVRGKGLAKRLFRAAA